MVSPDFLQLVAFVDQNVKTGRFSNASEVVREGLRLLEQRQAEDALILPQSRDVPVLPPLPPPGGHLYFSSPFRCLNAASKRSFVASEIVGQSAGTFSAKYRAGR